MSSRDRSNEAPGRPGTGSRDRKAEQRRLDQENRTRQAKDSYSWDAREQTQPKPAPAPAETEVKEVGDAWFQVYGRDEE